MAEWNTHPDIKGKAPQGPLHGSSPCLGHMDEWKARKDSLLQVQQWHEEALRILAEAYEAAEDCDAAALTLALDEYADLEDPSRSVVIEVTVEPPSKAPSGGWN